MPAAKRRRIPFIGQGCLGRSEFVNSEELINLYAQTDPTGKATRALYNCPGTITKKTLGSGPSRAGLEYDNKLYILSGDQLYSTNINLIPTLRGTINTSTGNAFLATNGLVVLLVDGSQGWTYTIASETFAQITDSNFPSNPEVCICVDGYFMVFDNNTQRVYYSTTGTSWGASDFFSAEASPDDLIGMIADHNEAILFGRTSTEIWRLAASGSWQVIDGSFLEFGLAAQGTPAKMDNSVYWLDNQLFVRALRNGTPVRVSTHEIETWIKNHTRAEITAATAFTVADEGHFFYQLTIGDSTRVLDAATGRWHTRAYMIPLTGEVIRHRANWCQRINNMNIVGDYEDGRIYQYDLDTFSDTEDEDTIQAIFTYRHLDAQGLNVFYELMEIEVESGVGTQTGQGVDPQIELRYSDDGGRTWSLWRQADIGRVGLYKTRARWGRLGFSDDRVFQARITDPVKRVIANANLEITVGT